MPEILVRGSGDVGSAVAIYLFRAGYDVVIHEGVQPTTTRRMMAFADAVFDGISTLEDVKCKKVDDFLMLGDILIRHDVIPLLIEEFSKTVDFLLPQILVDARMRKHLQPETQIHLAPLTIGLGPNFIVGETTHLVIETARGDFLGHIIERGSARPLQGEPTAIEGHARDRYLYAPVPGQFFTTCQIGDIVEAGQKIAQINSTPLFAPIGGVLRGLTRNDLPVAQKTKIVEIDPRIGHAQISGMAERPARIAEGVLLAIQKWEADKK
jgi:xanthine dehydrogenase accessory factor